MEFIYYYFLFVINRMAVQQAYYIKKDIKDVFLLVDASIIPIRQRVAYARHMLSSTDSWIRLFADALMCRFADAPAVKHHSLGSCLHETEK